MWKSTVMRCSALFILALWAVLPGNSQAYDITVSLKEAEQLALTRNRDLRFARRNIEAAAAETLNAAAFPNPTLAVNASHLNLKSDPTTAFSSRTPTESEIRIDQTFERGGKRALRMAQADSKLTATRFDFDDTLRQTRFNARSAWFELKLAEHHVELSGIIASQSEHILELARRRYQAGDLSGADLGRFETDAARARAGVRTAESTLTRARTALGILLADENHALQLVTRGDWPAERARLPDAATITTAISQRPDTLAAAARMEAARHNVGLAQAKRTRDVTVSLQYERQPADVTQPRNSLGLEVSIPLFLGNYFEGDIRHAHAELALAEDQLEAIRARIQAEINQLVDELQHASDRWHALQEQALPAARRTASAAELAFSKGAISALEFLDAQRILRTAELDTLQARSDLAQASAALDAALETTISKEQEPAS
ncbi:TolC family protein [Nitrosomonas eutropha]|uniref:Outer membrane efflux protein n=2 Tax=Nitrosomonas eutropha TaxID=916 RepID=Q0AFS7_NITEC|nr:TolC family protein [Nitrosomonas eutropha]ABI59805.1 outer membrane efflux protein [Nitrosomonas eutropha C91]